MQGKQGVGNASNCGNLNINNQVTSNFSVYPNPSNDFIKLNWKNASIFNITVYNLSARVVLSKENVNNNMAFDVNSVPAGTYIWRIIYYEYDTGLPKQIRGHVTLLR